MDRCEQEQRQRQSEYDKAYYNVPPKHMLPFFFITILLLRIRSRRSFRRLSTRSKIQDLFWKRSTKKHTQPHIHSRIILLRLAPYLTSKTKKKEFSKKRGKQKKKVWIIMDTSKKSLNQFGSVDGCNHTHHTHHIHHNTIPLIPTPHHTQTIHPRSDPLSSV